MKNLFSVLGMTTFAFVMGVLFITTTQAHVVLETPLVFTGAYFKAVFKVSHGCDGSPTKQVMIEIPEGFRGAKPMVKPNWEIQSQKDKLQKPYTSHGKTISEDVAKIVWRNGNLPSEFYDEFVIVGQAPMTVGQYYWKVTQICESGKLEWSEVPAEGKTLKDFKNPAALLKVIADPDDHSQHQH
ncbi:YcnI family copper-binding membrane protein [Polynucleobacter kasalickyi]|uniref:Uncharacterized protein YcnI n=1 Tax=Polynucleobacter kasalickyi TaxID=1938817 RepID=A0A1W2C894_9BURK|nr:YcnI family protein [Polynucleobacter kasalickyi]SMC81336.1 Uncharacterized protein YcnI [Polynucleobacter kasalickyi]